MVDHPIVNAHTLGYSPLRRNMLAFARPGAPWTTPVPNPL